MYTYITNTQTQKIEVIKDARLYGCVFGGLDGQYEIIKTFITFEITYQEEVK
jgi:hypothetical protein